MTWVTTLGRRACRGDAGLCDSKSMYHLRASDNALAALLDAGMVLAHPFVIGELALAGLRPRESVLNSLSDLPMPASPQTRRFLHFIDRHTLFGCGIGYVDAHLLAAVQLTPGAVLWTKDKRLHDVAAERGLANDPDPEESLIGPQRRR